MSAPFTREETLLLDLLRAALRGEPWTGDAGQEELRAAVTLAESHAVLPLLYPVLAGRTDDPRVTRRTEVCVRQYYRLLFLTRYYVETLRQAGVPVTVLKGAGVSTCYPVPEYRKSGDVDLLLLDRSQLHRAVQALEATGARQAAEQHANHHVALVGQNGIDVELHLTLIEDFDDRRVNRYIHAMQQEFSQHVRDQEIFPGVALPVLDQGFQAFSLLMHMLQHFLRAGFGLRLLCDWVVFWNRPVPPEQLTAYHNLTETCGVAGFSRLVTGACAAFLGLDGDRAAPLLGENAPGRELCADFLREALDAQEFGHTAAPRMVTLRGTGLTDYVREFHHQMRLNFPRAGRVPPLWPGLWTATLARFLHNNRTLRKTSLSSVLKTADHRSRFMKELRLFRPGRGKKPGKS